MGYDAAYYYTKRWLNIRGHKLNQVGRMCEKCKNSNELNVHHLHYKTFGSETLDDLIVLCKRCHNDEHFHNSGYYKVIFENK